MLGKTAVVPPSFAQRQRKDVFFSSSGYKSEYTLFHPRRVIKYVFLDGSQNIVPSLALSSGFDSQVGYLEPTKGYPLVIPGQSWTPDPECLPIFTSLSKKPKQSSWDRPFISRDRLPVFRQLCGEMMVPGPATSHRKGPNDKEEKLKERATVDPLLEDMAENMEEEEDGEDKAPEAKVAEKERGTEP